MNTKQKWNRFWALKFRANAGFTLVELIVVIAILAILAGVAVPAYSGYIEKANKAADLQLLGAVNTAFAAACLENGVDVTDVDEAGIEKAAVAATFARTTATTEGTGWRVGGAWAKVDGAAIADFKKAFLRYYGEGNTGTFKVMTGLIFDVEKHMFVDPDSTSSVTIGYGGAKITITSEQIQLLKDSSFYGEGMTSAGLLQQVDNVAVVANGMGTIKNIMGTSEFGAYALNALDVTSQAELEAKVDEIALAKAGLPADFDIGKATEEEYNKYAAAKEQIYGNALILYTAQQTTNMGDDAKTLLNGVTSTQISQNMYGSTAEQQQTGVNQAALAYGMYYAYVNSSACTDSSIKGNSNIAPNDVITALDTNTEFQAYLTSPQGQKDMDAYLEALSVVNSGAQTPGAVENLLTNGFVDLNDLLTGTMGK